MNSSYGTFTKSKKRIQNLKKQEIKDTFIKNELDNACSQHGMAYGDFKHLPRRRAFDNVLHHQDVILLKIPNMMVSIKTCLNDL